MQPIWDAIGRGDESTAIALIPQTDLSETTSDGESLLHIAAGQGLTMACKALLQAGVSPNIENPRLGNMCPLNRAAAGARVETMRVLLDLGANVDGNTSRNRAPLCDAASSADMAVGGAAAAAAAVKLLLDSGANPNRLSESGRMPLSCAEGGVITKMLLERGAEPNLADEDGVSPLLSAAMTGDHEKVAALLAVGARTDFKTSKDGFTALDFAVGNGDARMQQLLKSAGAPRGVFMQGERSGGCLAATMSILCLLVGSILVLI